VSEHAPSAVQQAQSSISAHKSHDRSHSFSFGQTVFFSTSRQTTPVSDADSSISSTSAALKPLNRSRAQSETIFKDGSSLPDVPGAYDERVSRSQRISSYMSSVLLRPHVNECTSAVEADICDPSDKNLRLRTGLEPDPFAPDARTYYTPDTLIPVTPFELATGHARDDYFAASDSLSLPAAPASSRSSYGEEMELINSLRAQLVLQEEMAKQFEIDLAARDELVTALREKLAGAQHEGEQRKQALRGWKRKVSELERACRYLEEEVDRSTQSSVERSVLEEASADALRVLHVKISELEKSKRDAERKTDFLRREIEKRDNGLEVNNKSSSNELYEMRQIGADHHQCQPQILALTGELERVRKEHHALVKETEQSIELRGAREQELAMLRVELEAQWRRTEEGSDVLSALKTERDAARRACEALENNVASLERQITGFTNRLAEAEEQCSQHLKEAQIARSAQEEGERQIKRVRRDHGFLNVGLILYTAPNTV
jgi:predicted  nucleic acid-binding Zn-ribbon protein